MYKYQDVPDKIIMDRHYFMVIMDKLEEVVKRVAKVELNIESLTDIYEEKLDKVDEKLDKVIEFSETIQARYLEDKLEKALQSGELRLRFIKETEKALNDEAKQYYGGE